MANCVVCNQELSFFESILSLNNKRCRKCDEALKQIQHQWFYTIEQAFNNGGVPRELEYQVYQHFNQIKMPQDLGAPVMQRLQRLRMLSETKWGNIPIIKTDIHLDSDEYAHFDLSATYYKPNKTLKPLPGRLIGTNKKCYFLSSTGNASTTIDWNNVSKIDQEQTTISMPPIQKGYRPRVHQAYGVRLTVSKGSGGGLYEVQDPEYTKTIMDALVRLWKRQLVIYKEQATHGEIPQHIKNAVYRRDCGKCVQCGYSGEYLEYDHITPRSKGGPNTVENIQLLCRKCNLKKSDRL